MMRLDLTMVAEEELGRAAGAMSRVRCNGEATVFVRRSEKEKNEEQRLPFNLEGEADRPFNREKMILIVHVVEK